MRFKSVGAEDGSRFDIVLWQNGTAQTMATYESTAWGGYTLSPDGKRHAFVSGLALDSSGDVIDFETAQISIMDANGQNQRQLTNFASYKGGENWSPDGKTIAFGDGYAAMGTANIWLVDVPGYTTPAIAAATTAPITTAVSPASAIVPATPQPAVEAGPPVTHLRTDNLKIAVVQFQEKGALGAEDAGEIIAGWMNNSLYNTGVFTLYERVLLQDVLAEQDIGLTGAMDESTTAEIGKLFGVDAIVTGTISKFGNTFTVNSRLIDTKTAKLLSTGKVSAKDLDIIATMMELLATKLATER